MKPKTLYHKGKGGAMYSWTIWTKGSEIYTEYGQVDGKKQVAMKRAESKNVGRSNQTSPEQQAELEAEAMYKHQLERKYSTTPVEAQDPVFLPMLAHKFEDAKKIVYPVHVQPKLNGVRCLASWTGYTIRLLSRGGKEYDVPHLKRDIATFLNESYVLDGEIYKHGVTLQEVTRLVKKYRPGPDGTDSLQLWVYDMFSMDATELPWSERSTFVDGLASKLWYGEKASKIKVSSVVPVQSVTADSEREVYVAQGKYVQEGFEGGIVRLLGGTYELGHRSRSLLKVKSFKDAEYHIVGYEHGVGKFEDCVIWICVTPDNSREFKVVPKGTLEEKRQWLKEAAKHVGEKLTVKYFELSEDGIPIFPVGLGIRDEE